jgi:hypothetical protein
MTEIFKNIETESLSRNEHRDCAVKAVSIATGYEYDDVHYVFEVCGRKPRKGTQFYVTEKAVKLLKFRMIDVTKHFKSKSVRTLEREIKDCKGNFLVRVTNHLLPVVDGKVHDWTSGRCHRIVSIHMLREVSREFHKADLRNIVCVNIDEQQVGKDVTKFYKLIGNRMPSNCSKIILTEDEFGPVFVGV